MGFGAAVKSGFSKYATFSGRSRRSEFWWWQVFAAVVILVGYFADVALKTNTIDGGNGFKFGWFYLIASLVLLLPSIAVTIRRLHDSGHSGWWWLLVFVCGIGGIVVLIFCLMDSKPDNQWGPNPKGA